MPGLCKNATSFKALIWSMENYCSVEETLIRTGKWAIFGIRLPGYFPLTTVRTNEGLKLKLKLLSFNSLYTFFISLISVVGIFYICKVFYYKFFRVNHELSSIETTDRFLWFSIIVLVTYTTFIRCSRVYYCRASLKFWIQTVTLLTSFSKSKGYELREQDLRTIYTNIRNFTAVYQISSLIRLFYNLYYFISDINDPEANLIQIESSFLEIFVGLVLYYHTSYTVWLRFLVNSTELCYKMLQSQIETFLDKKTKVTLNYKDLGILNEATNSGRMKEQSRNHELRTESFLDLLNSRPENEEECDFEELERVIRVSLRSYEEIETHIHEFNKMFGFTLILESLFAFVLIIVNVYNFEESLVDNDFWYAVMSTLPTLTLAISLYKFTSDSSVLSSRGVMTLKSFQEFLLPIPKSISNYSQIFSLQLKVIALISRVGSNAPNISAAHFFTMDRHLLTSFIGTVTTYLIVLFQFRGQPEPRSQNSTNLTSSS